MCIRDSTWTQGLATLGAGVLGLYIIARMIIEDGRLERELLHGGQPDDEEPVSYTHLDVYKRQPLKR